MNGDSQNLMNLAATLSQMSTKPKLAADGPRVPSTLSVTAAEFVPSRNSGSGDAKASGNELNSKWFDIPINYFSDKKFNFVPKFEDFLCDIKLNPDKINESCRMFTYFLDDLIRTEASPSITIKSLINLIIYSVTMNAYPSNLATKIILFYYRYYSTLAPTNFRIFLLHACQLQYKYFEDDQYRKVKQKEFRGFALFIADLFVVLSIESRKQHVLEVPLLVILDKLLVKDFSEDNTKTATQILILTGFALNEKVDELMKVVDRIIQMPNFSFTTRTKLGDVLELRKNNWANVTIENHPEFQFNDYSGDQDEGDAAAVPWSTEEAYYDEMTEDMDDDYEKFLTQMNS